jgi:long-chain fatty acid transport protein
MAAVAGVETLEAGGFSLPDQDAFATARGEAFVATADNSSAIYYNPAGITQLDGSDVRLGVYGIDLDPSYKAPGSSTTYNNEATLHAVPEIFYTQGLKDTPVTLGLGVYSPFGLGLKWPQDSGLRTAGDESNLEDYRINPVAAIKLPWNLSVAAGLMVDYSSINLEEGLTPIPNHDLFQYKGNGWSTGYNLGLLWQPIEKLSFGATFRSSARMDYSGQTVTESQGAPLKQLPATYSSATLNYRFPLEVAGGISYRPTKKWNLEFDTEYTDWSELSSFNIHQDNASSVLPLNNIPVTFDWTSSWYFEWGATRYFDNGWHVSAGYIFNENAAPDAHYTPLVADGNHHFFSLGTGYKGRHFNFDVAYQLGYGPNETVTGSAAPLGYPSSYHPADGTYAYLSNAVLLTLGWHF